MKKEENKTRGRSRRQGRKAGRHGAWHLCLKVPATLKEGKRAGKFFEFSIGLTDPMVFLTTIWRSKKLSP